MLVAVNVAARRPAPSEPDAAPLRLRHRLFAGGEPLFPSAVSEKGRSAISQNPPFLAWFSYATTPVDPVGAQSCCVALEGATSLRQGYGTAGKIAPLPFGCVGAALSPPVKTDRIYVCVFGDRPGRHCRGLLLKGSPTARTRRFRTSRAEPWFVCMSPAERP